MLHICCFGKTFHFFPSSAFPKIDASISLSLASLSGRSVTSSVVN